MKKYILKKASQYFISFEVMSCLFYLENCGKNNAETPVVAYPVVANPKGNDNTNAGITTPAEAVRIALEAKKIAEEKLAQDIEKLKTSNPIVSGKVDTLFTKGCSVSKEREQALRSVKDSKAIDYLIAIGDRDNRDAIINSNLNLTDLNASHITALIDMLNDNNRQIILQNKISLNGVTPDAIRELGQIVNEDNLKIILKNLNGLESRSIRTLGRVTSRDNLEALFKSKIDLNKAQDGGYLEVLQGIKKQDNFKDIISLGEKIGEIDDKYKIERLSKLENNLLKAIVKVCKNIDFSKQEFCGKFFDEIDDLDITDADIGVKIKKLFKNKS